MNKRIQELIKEADRRCNETRGVFDEILAELIVRECMDVVRDINQEYDGGSTVVNAADEIAEYFGVE